MTELIAQSPEWWESAIKDWGLGGMLLLMLAYAARVFWKWATPHADSIIKAHITTVTGLTDTQRTLAAALTMHDQTEMPKLDSLCERMDEVHENVVDVRDDVKKIAEWTRPKTGAG